MPEAQPQHPITIPNRQIIAVMGADAVDFLHKLTTQDLLPLKDIEGICYTLLLNPQGRYLFDFFVVHQGNSLMIDCAADTTEALLQTLNRYKLRYDVQFQILPKQAVTLELGGATALADPRHPQLGIRHYHATGIADTSGSYDDYRIALGIVEPSSDMQSGQDMPLDFELDKLNAISFGKGCYPGQEITARTHNRGKEKYKIELRTIDETGDSKIVASAGGKALVQVRRNAD